MLFKPTFVSLVVGSFGSRGVSTVGKFGVDVDSIYTQDVNGTLRFFKLERRICCFDLWNEVEDDCDWFVGFKEDELFWI